MNREEARNYFYNLGLTYDAITINDLHLLKWLLNRNFSEIQVQSLKDKEQHPYWHRVNDAKYYKGKYNNEKMISAFLTGKGGYFEAREVISFNSDGFIGFCGEVDKNNSKPVIAAFIEWCDCMKKIQVSKC